MVVSVTEPKLLIKILHVTFTGAPVKWNDNDMTGGKKKALIHIIKDDSGLGMVKVFL